MYYYELENWKKQIKKIWQKNMKNTKTSYDVIASGCFRCIYFCVKYIILKKKILKKLNELTLVFNSKRDQVFGINVFYYFVKIIYRMIPILLRNYLSFFLFKAIFWSKGVKNPLGQKIKKQIFDAVLNIMYTNRIESISIKLYRLYQILSI